MLAVHVISCSYFKLISSGRRAIVSLFFISSEFPYSETLENDPAAWAGGPMLSACRCALIDALAERLFNLGRIAFGGQPPRFAALISLAVSIRTQHIRSLTTRRCTLVRPIINPPCVGTNACRSVTSCAGVSVTSPCRTCFPSPISLSLFME